MKFFWTQYNRLDPLMHTTTWDIVMLLNIHQFTIAGTFNSHTLTFNYNPL